MQHIAYCQAKATTSPWDLPIRNCLRPRAAVQREEGLGGSAGPCFQPAGLRDPGTNACLTELMVLREVVFVLCVCSNKIHPPLAFTVTAKSGN